jgi:hypothetical protein
MTDGHRRLELTRTNKPLRLLAHEDGSHESMLANQKTTRKRRIGPHRCTAVGVRR